jgi:hypothetical protein
VKKVKQIWEQQRGALIEETTLKVQQAESAHKALLVEVQVSAL